MTPAIRSPLRYPGGKSKALPQILPLVPPFDEFREPFVGGGSVFIHLKQDVPHARFWINDLNRDVYLFWQTARDHNPQLVDAVSQIRRQHPSDGRALFERYKDNWDALPDFERAVRFFVLNRITFSGTIDSGGFSQQAFKKRFTESSIQRLAALESLLQGVTITNNDYQPLLDAPGENVFIFLDPPYYSNPESRLYGKKGDLHTGFDHARFAAAMRACPHRWLITYDDCPEVRDLFSFAHIKPWKLQYGMNNYGQTTAAAGDELFIANYPLP